MPKPNTSFDLSVEDLDLIETALRQSKAELCEKVMGASDAKAKAEIADIHDLLGRLHNQKTFYRPREGYIGG